MRPHRPELADVFRAHEKEFLARWRSVLPHPQSSDGVHPNPAGYALMGNLAEKAIATAFATSQKLR